MALNLPLKKILTEPSIPRAYTAVVYKEGSHVYAKDEKGSIICQDSATSCLQEAVNYIAQLGGGRVYIKRGTYYVNSYQQYSQGIDVPKNISIVFEGEDPYTTKIVAGVSMDSLIMFRARNAVVRNITFDGNWLANVTVYVMNHDRDPAPIDYAEFKNAVIQNSNPNTAGWVFSVWDAYNDVNKTGVFGIDTVVVEDTIVKGPSSLTNDAVAFTFVDKVFINRSKFVDLERVVNSYVVNYFICRDTLFSGFKSYASLVVDRTLYAEIDGCIFRNNNAPVRLHLPFEIYIKSIYDDYEIMIEPVVPTPPEVHNVTYPDKILVEVADSVLNIISIVGDNYTKLALLKVERNMFVGKNNFGVLNFGVPANPTISNIVFKDNYIDMTNYNYFINNFNGTATIINSLFENNVIVNLKGNWQTVIDPSTKVINNTGFLGVNTGQAVIMANTTSVTVNHGLICAPRKVLVTPLGQPPGSIWVSNITATSFDINVSAAPATDLPVAWYAEC
jgi:hypothetical protein